MTSTEPRSRTSAVVVNWNGAHLLCRNLPTWLEQSLPFDEILVVDNGSRDGSIELLDGRPQVKTLPLASNRGFAGGANRGIEVVLSRLHTRFVALINNDVALDPGWHEAALAAIRDRKAIGGAATCLLDAQDPSRVQTAGIDWSRDGWAQDHMNGEPAPPATDAATQVFGVCAAATLFRRELFESVGLFDESLFAYQEDVDLALRARSLGWSFVTVPAARGLHVGAASNRPFPLGGSWADFYNARNRVAVLAKSLPADLWWPAITKQARIFARSWPEGRGAAVSAGMAHGALRFPRFMWARFRRPRGGGPSHREFVR